MTAVRSRGDILGELRALVTLQQDSRQELAEVQRHEWRLVTAIENRAGQIDRVLEELVEAMCSSSD